jgi:hypothetical protein
VKVPASALLLLAMGACEGELQPLPPARTVRISEAPATIVGSGPGTCSHDPSSTERWCAFARGAELWAFELDRALAGAPCDGSSPSCVKLTSELWTGQPLFPPSHPSAHGFRGDTLVFYARSTTGNTDAAFVGPVQAWRPHGQPRALTGPRGRACIAQERSASLLCIDDQRGSGAQIEIDVLAGTFAGDPGSPLPLAATVRPIDEQGDRLWLAGFSPDGRHFVLSDRVPEGAKMQRLRVVESAEVGRTPLRELLRDVASWQFSPDGRQLYYLRGFNYGAGGGDAGTLTAVDFPSGENARELQPRVGRFEVYGAAGGGTRALGIFQDLRGVAGRFALLSDPAQPGQLVSLGNRVQDAVVSPDLRHSLLIDEDEAGDLGSFVARNDGSGRCRLAAHPGHTIFAPTFLTSPRLVLWGEESADNAVLTEGWAGDPDSCQVGQRFSGKLAYYQDTRRGLLWGDEDETPATMTLHHAPFAGAALDLDHATEVRRNTDTKVALVDGRYLLYTVSVGAPEETGLFLHGPID